MPVIINYKETVALSLPFAWLRPVKNLGSSLSPPSQLLQHVASCNFSLEWFGPGILMSRCSGAFRCVPAPAHLNQTTQSPLQHSVKFSRVWLRCVKGLSLCLFRLWRATGPTSESPQRHHGPFRARPSLTLSEAFQCSKELLSSWTPQFHPSPEKSSFS